MPVGVSGARVTAAVLVGFLAVTGAVAAALLNGSGLAMPGFDVSF